MNFASGTPTNYFYTQDHLGSTREMTKTVSGTTTIEAQYAYDPYGVATKLQGSQDADFQYASYYMHAPSGLNLPVFINRDPIGEAGGVNLYGYVGNNPINKQDPFGLQTVQYPGPGEWVRTGAPDNSRYWVPKFDTGAGWTHIYMQHFIGTLPCQNADPESRFAPELWRQLDKVLKKGLENAYSVEVQGKKVIIKSLLTIEHRINGQVVSLDPIGRDRFGAETYDLKIVLLQDTDLSTGAPVNTLLTMYPDTPPHSLLSKKP